LSLPYCHQRPFVTGDNSDKTHTLEARNTEHGFTIKMCIGLANEGCAGSERERLIIQLVNSED